MYVCVRERETKRDRNGTFSFGTSELFTPKYICLKKKKTSIIKQNFYAHLNRFICLNNILTSEHKT